MQSLRLSSALLPDLIEALKGWGAVWAPVEKAPGVFSLQPIDDAAQARPDALRTILPFKKLLMKPRFTMVERDGAGDMRESRDNDVGPVVLFGLHACDIHALRILDMIYLSGYEDGYYARNRAPAHGRGLRLHARRQVLLPVHEHGQRGRGLRPVPDRAGGTLPGHGVQRARGRDRARPRRPLPARRAPGRARLPGARASGARRRSRWHWT